MNFRISDPNDHLFADEVLPTNFKRALKEIKMATNQQEVPQVVMKAINEAVNKLRVTNCAFKIMLPDGEITTHDIDRLEPKPNAKRRQKRYAHGELKNHYWPHLANLQVGEVAEIPYDDRLTADALQSSATAYLSVTWGNGSYTTSTNKDKQVIEVLRLR